MLSQLKLFIRRFVAFKKISSCKVFETNQEKIKKALI
jgi:hypothetical protein